MAEHNKLIEQLDLVNSLSTEERLELARKQRREQVRRWMIADAEYRDLLDISIEKSNQVRFDNCTTLLDASARNDLEEIYHLLQIEKINPNQTNEDGLTALHQACIDNFEEVVVVLLNNGADVNATDSEMWTPLHAACTCGNTEIARILVDRDADLLALNADQNMPYDICDEEDTLRFIEGAMSSRGITQEQINLMRTSEERQIIKDLTDLMKHNQFDPNRNDSINATYLHYAASHGFIELGRFLIEHGSHLHVQDQDGWTPLHAAACWGQIEMVEILGLEYFADPSIKNKLGETASEVTDDEDVKRLLMKIKQKQKQRNKFGIHTLQRWSSSNASKRRNGTRGQSMRGRSKRDKRKGISAVEALSEAQSLFKTLDIKTNSDKESELIDFNDEDLYFQDPQSDPHSFSSCQRSDQLSTGQTLSQLKQLRLQSRNHPQTSAPSTTLPVMSCPQVFRETVTSPPQKLRQKREFRRCVIS